MAQHRVAEISRKTKETDIQVKIDLDGTGVTDIDTGVPFFDHMLDAFGRHGLFDLTVHCKGDIEVDAHHSVEDCGIVLGQALAQAIGEKKGIVRYGSSLLPMDETLVMAAVDFSGRGGCYADLNIPAEQVGNFDTELGVEFFIAFASNANITLHVRQIAGANSHHILEASFKAVTRALKEAVAIDPRIADVVPSTKGAL
jgi:imidazoleglycerol-phosphate dehydratase